MGARAYYEKKGSFFLANKEGQASEGGHIVEAASGGYGTFSWNSYTD